MKRIKQTLEKTRIVDGIFISKEALESMVDQVNKYYVSIWNGHDPRLPPIGRVVSAELVKTGNESYEVVGDLELFDESTFLEDFGCKEIKLKKNQKEKLQITYDKNFLSAKDQCFISEISKMFNNESRKEEKHSIDHVSIIAICASFAFGVVATGFLKKVGEDSYSVLKDKS